MQTRLDAMLDAAEIMQPALEDFYATLSNEQKARFNSPRPRCAAGELMKTSHSGARLKGANPNPLTHTETAAGFRPARCARAPE